MPFANLSVSREYHLKRWHRARDEWLAEHGPCVDCGSWENLEVEGNRRSWIWEIRSNAALRFLNEILPYMKEPKKIARARLLVGEYKAATVRNGRYSEQRRKLKIDFERRFFSLTGIVDEARGRLADGSSILPASKCGGELVST